jgi:hypothetical protein
MRPICKRSHGAAWVHFGGFRFRNIEFNLQIWQAL